MADPTNALAPKTVNALIDAYRQYIGDPFAAVAGGGVRGYFGFAPPNYGGESARQAYRIGQAVSNMPGAGAPAGILKATAATPLLAKTLKTQFVYHGSPRGPIVGAPKTAPHDETGILGFSVTRSEPYAQTYANDAMQRHWDVENPTPTVTKFKLTGKVVPYEKLMDDVRKEYRLGEYEIASNDQILKYAKKKGIVAIDYQKNLGIDEISVLYPEALQQLK